MKTNFTIIVYWFALAAHASAAELDKQLFRDPGFESAAAGPLPARGPIDGWEVQRTGRDVIHDRLVVECIEETVTAKTDRKCLSLSIPRETVGFEFVTIGQRVKLATDKEYKASAWVRWPGGPDAAPVAASATSGRR